MKKVSILLFAILLSCKLTQAQYTGGNGRGDVQQVGSTSIGFPYTGGNGRGDAMVEQSATSLNGVELSPTITSFSPTSGCAGSGTVIITGTSFTGAAAVSIGGTVAGSFAVNSDTQITATIGSGTTGTIQVTTPAGTATSSGIFTVNTYSTNTTIASTCDSYTWSVNGQNYSASGSYTSTSGCVNNVLNLTITPSTYLSTTASACDSYTWSVNGSTYTSTGAYTHQTGTCSYAVLNLTITPFSATAAVVTQPACFGGLGAVNIVAVGGTAPYSGDGLQPAGAGIWNFTVGDANGCVATTNTITLIEPNKVVGTLSSTDASCGSNNGTASVTAVGGTSPYSYLWSSGQTTASITSLYTGVYTVVVTDGNGCTGTATATIGNSGSGPSAAGPITGAAGVCRNTILTYSIPSQADATSYQWTLPSGATGASSSNSITVTFSSAYNGGFICAAPVNNCGSGASSCINVPVLTVRPPYPGIISGPSFACGPNTYTYSIAAVPNATSYNWTVTGTGISIVGGNGTRNLQVSVSSGFGQGTISVLASNCVGNSSFRLQTVTGIPTHSSPLTGTIYPCQNTSGNYSINAVNGTSSYTWSITGNASVVVSSANTCTVNFHSNWSGGTLTVTTSSVCGSYSRSYNLGSAPGQPGGITGPASNLCFAAGVTSAVYSISPVTGATSYSWSLPAGMSITTNNGTSISVSIDNTFTGGSVCVTANNACGSSVARCLTTTSKTSAPGTIVGPLFVCQSETAVQYSVSPVSGATSYSWSIGGGATITPTGNSATVNYTTATSVSAAITVNALNLCDVSSPSRSTATIDLGCRLASSQNERKLKVFPNPTEGLIVLLYETSSPGPVSIEIVDVTGRSVISLHFQYETSGKQRQEIQLRDYGITEGLYLLRLIRNDELDDIRILLTN